jgi:putative transposase
VYRRSIRLQGYDYAQDGAYFVTLLTYRRAHLFGDVSDGEMTLSTPGCVADTCWWGISDHFPGVTLDAFVVMPNHLHGIIVINRWQATSSQAEAPVRARHDVSHDEDAHIPVGATHVSPLQPQTMPPNGPKPGSLAAIIGSYKSAVARQINQMRQTPGQPVWHRNYYEHIIRSESTLNRIREYIRYNPVRWSEDEYYAPDKT